MVERFNYCTVPNQKKKNMSNLLKVFPLFESRLFNTLFPKDGYIEIPNSALVDIDGLLPYFESLAKVWGVDFKETGYTIAVKVVNQLVERVYQPAIMTNKEGEVIVAWGKTSTVLEPHQFKVVKGLSMTPLEDDGWDYDNEPHLSILFDSKAVIKEFGSFEEMDNRTRELTNRLKNGTLAPLLKVRGESSGFPVKPHTVLEAGRTYKVVGYGQQTGEFRGTKIITNYVEVVLPNGAVQKVVAKGNIVKVLDAKPEISPEEPAKLTVISFVESEYNGQVFTKTNAILHLSERQDCFRSSAIKQLAASQDF